MIKIATRGERAQEVRNYILANVEEHPKDIARVTIERFDTSRQSVVRHLQALVAESLLVAVGKTKAREYRLNNYVDKSFNLEVIPTLEENVEWRTKLLPFMDGLPESVRDICHYGFTEMLNNVLDHSGSRTAMLKITRNALQTALLVADEGVGIFDKIQADFNLSDTRHAILELCKGKLTSDPQTHTGEGVFFTSRMFDEYIILSGALAFIRKNALGQDFLVDVEDREGSLQGTVVQMKISNNSSLTIENVFKRYAAESDDYGFTRTVVPVSLVQYEGEKLVSRSQAKRLVARFDRFQEVALDFTGVTEIGPAFADEIFRVYQNEHPSVHLYALNAGLSVQQIIQRVTRGEIQAPP